MDDVKPNESSFWDFKGIDPDMDNKMLMATPYPVHVILLFYLWFVLKSGPELMKRKPPLQFGPVLTAYNAMQVFLSAYIVRTGIECVYQTGFISKTCHIEGLGTARQLIKHNLYIYFLTKLCELLDTIFFVLRKKDNQISFLHVWHHATMVSWTWYVGKYHETDSPVFFNTINSMVHVVMYGYYGLSVLPFMKKFLWWKKYITAMQMIQLTVMCIHAIMYHLVSECKPDYIYVFIVCGNSLLVFYMFGMFYTNTYKNTKNL